MSALDTHPVIPHDRWLEARKRLLEQEKEFMRLRDLLSQARRDLPWEAVDKDYVFDGAQGEITLAQAFEGRSQLVVYHFMFHPDWDAGCPHCSHWADSFDGAIVHLNHRDVTMIVVSRAPIAKLTAYQQRMGWRFRWLSSERSGFNADYHVSFTAEELQAKQAFYNYALQDPGVPEREGLSVFYRDPGGARIPYLLHVCARHRHDQRGLPDSGSRAERA